VAQVVKVVFLIEHCLENRCPSNTQLADSAGISFNIMTLKEKEETTRKNSNGRKQAETTRNNLFWGNSSSGMQFWGNSNLASDNI